jgi:hypothetical protein
MNRPSSRAEPSRAEPSRAEPIFSPDDRRPAASRPDVGQLRAWLQHVVSSAIDWLDQLDAETEDLEGDEIEDAGWRHEA